MFQLFQRPTCPLLRDSSDPFRSAVRIEQEIAKQEKAKQKEYLEHLFVKRKEIETNLLLIQDYINKATL